MLAKRDVVGRQDIAVVLLLPLICLGDAIGICRRPVNLTCLVVVQGRICDNLFRIMGVPLRSEGEVDIETLDRRECEGEAAHHLTPLLLAGIIIILNQMADMRSSGIVTRPNTIGILCGIDRGLTEELIQSGITSIRGIIVAAPRGDVGTDGCPIREEILVVGTDTITVEIDILHITITPGIVEGSISRELLCSRLDAEIVLGLGSGLEGLLNDVGVRIGVTVGGSLPGLDFLVAPEVTTRGAVSLAGIIGVGVVAHLQVFPCIHQLWKSNSS